MKSWCSQKSKPCSMANEYGYCQITACCNTSKPTVKAIPKEWIRDYMLKLPDGSEAYECILVMLEEWEKENG